jgi:hypothetical protein
MFTLPIVQDVTLGAAHAGNGTNYASCACKSGCRRLAILGKTLTLESSQLFTTRRW